MATQQDTEFGLMTAQGDGQWELEQDLLIGSYRVASRDGYWHTAAAPLAVGPKRVCFTQAERLLWKIAN